VRSTQGQRGGYRLAKPAGKVTLAEVVRLLDGPIAPTDSVSRYFYASTPIERERTLVRLFKEIRDMIARKLETTTLADVLEGWNRRAFFQARIYDLPYSVTSCVFGAPAALRRGAVNGGPGDREHYDPWRAREVR
jgi:DNA-binding IscR family transcriptional regulator